MASLCGKPAEASRAFARGVILLCVVLLFLAAMDVQPLLMAIVAASGTFLANGILIFQSTQGAKPGNYSSVNHETAETSGVEGFKSCVQGYAMVPITLMAILCLMLYKAEQDAINMRQEGSLPNSEIATVAFLRFADCGDLLENSTRDEKKSEELAITMQNNFMGSVLFAAIAVLILLSGGIFLPEVATNQASADRRRAVREVARCAHFFAVAVLTFAAVGFFPFQLSCAASAITGSASILSYLFWECSSEEAANATGVPTGGPKTVRGVVHAFGFWFVTFPCVYCVGCLIIESMALRPDSVQAEVHLRFVGFRMAFFAAEWFVVMLSIRACFRAVT